MLQDAQLFLAWITLAVVSYWLVPGALPRVRQLVLLVYSVILVYALAAPACLMVMWMAVVGWAGPRLFDRVRTRASLAAMIVCGALPLVVERTVLPDLGLVYTLGVAFATLRCVGMLMDAYTLKERYDGIDVALCLFFLPLYTVGPLEPVRSFAPERFGAFPGWPFVLRGLSRICLGLFKTTFIATGLIALWRDGMLDATPEGFAAASILATGGFVLLSWAFTYVNFSGFCDIAIGVSRLFGLTIMENFNYPFLARNLQEFWKRWHISLGNWITRFLYFPVVATVRRYYAPFVATFLAFSLIGWWHAASVTYLAWGALHGAGLCVVLGWQQFMKKHHRDLYRRLTANRAWAVTGWALTMAYVAWVQTFANLGSLDRAVAMTKALLGL